MIRSFQGWVRGEPITIQAVKVDGHSVEIKTAAAFVEMLKHALEDDIDLQITSGLRTYEQQQELYNKLKPQGIPTAKPGHSTHHHNAIDIRTGITFAEFQKGKRSQIFEWLHLNSEAHGFVRAVRSEPWHYEYRGS